MIAFIRGVTDPDEALILIEREPVAVVVRENASRR
jgi:hypothetical protein